MKQIKSFIVSLIISFTIIGILPISYAIDNTYLGNVNITEEAVSGTDGVYKLVMKAKSNIKNNITLAMFNMSFDNNVIQPVHCSTYGDISNNNDAFAKSCAFVDLDTAYFTVADIKWATDEYNHRSAFSLTMQTSDIVSGTSISEEKTIAEFYYRIKQGQTTNKETFRFETYNVKNSLISQFYDDANKQNAITLVTKDEQYMYYGTNTAVQNLSANLNYTGIDKDTLQSISFSDDELTLAVPALSEGKTATLNLAQNLKKIGFSGDYTDNINIIWSIIDGDLTDAKLDQNGILSIDNKCNAGTVTITATVDGYDNISDSIDVKITKSKPKAANITINGTEEIIIPNDDKNTSITENYTATVTDQFGDNIQNAVINWSISTIPEDKSIKINNGILSIEKDAAKNNSVEVTIKASTDAIISEKVVIVKRDNYISNVEIVDSLSSDSIFTPEEGYTISIPDDGYNSLKLYANVYDNYYNKIPDYYNIMWFDNFPHGYVTKEDNSIIINVPSDAIAGEYDLTATAENITKATKIKLIHSKQLNVDMSDINLSDKVYDGLAISYSGNAKANQDVKFNYTWYDIKNNSDLGSNAPVNAGHYRLIATIDDYNYNGYGYIDFNITSKPLTSEMVTDITDSFEYNGQAQTPTVTVTDGEKTLVKDIDYTVEYSNNINVGNNATITIIGKGNYSGQVNKIFSIISSNNKKLIITGTAQVGKTLNATISGEDLTGFTFTWYRNNIEIENAKGSNYILAYKDSNKEIMVKATDNNTNETFTSDTVKVDKMAITGKITLTYEKKQEINTISVGDIIKANADIENDIDINYQWYVNGQAVDGETNNYYTVKDGDTTIYVIATPVSEDYNGKVQSITLELNKALITGKLTIIGGNTVGDELTATIDGLTYGVHYSLIWLRDNVKIATSEKYTITKDDKNTIISAKAIATGDYSGEIISENVITIDATVPDAPVLTATAGNEKVNLNWTIPHNGGSDITGCKLSYVKSSEYLSVKPTVVELNPNTKSYTVLGLTNDTEYIFTIVAENNKGNSQASTVKATPLTSNSDNALNNSDNISNPYTSAGLTTVITTPSINILGDIAKAEVTTSTMDKAIQTVIDAAKTNDTIPVIKINIHNNNTDSIELTLPKTSLIALSQTTYGELIITSDIATVTIDSKTLKNILEKSDSNIILNISKIKQYELNSIQQTIVGGLPVFDISLVSGNETISDFGDGTITVNIPYSLPSGLDENKVVVYYLDNIGDISACNTIYTLKNVTFTANHFSKYFIGYNDYSNYDDNNIDMTTFDDVSNDRWSAEYIYNLYNLGIVNGISNDIFSPETNITRAEFVKMLANIAGTNLNKLNISTNFTDVESDSWYEDYIVWAVYNGIASGTSDTTFSPDENITREQIATMIYRFVEYKGIELPKIETVINFVDENTFSPWAVDAISAVQSAGIINALDDDYFAPTYYTTREQACKMLFLLLEIIND